MSRKRKSQSQKKKRRNQKKTSYPVPNRNYKSSIFAMVFSDKKRLLELYNGISGKNYKDPELLEINTLENAIYMAIRNDLSFLIASRLSLYEHQSTYSPNLPLRMLLYLADLYAGLTKEENLYGETKVLLPPPQFVIFYNGEKPQPDRQILRLSDLYAVEELVGICGVYRPCAQICEGIADCRSGGTSDHGMYPGRDSEGIPEKKPCGGEENEHLRI